MWRYAVSGECWLMVYGWPGANPDHWMNRRYNRRDIPHVCRSGRAMGCPGRNVCSANAFCILEEGLREIWVVNHFGIGTVAARYLEFRTCSECASFKAPSDSPAELL